jgi:branched-chain amino acid transport system ATP-binding protein
MLRLEEVKIAYKEIGVIDGIDLRIEEGGITVLIGANGVGKTTIVNAIVGVHKPRAGRILYGRGKDEVDLVKVPAHRMTSLGVSICPEGRQLFPNMTVYENLEMGAYVRNDKNVKADIEALLRQFPILGERRNQKARTLSGGEQEILAIARALVIKPKLLILDEPSWGLAPLMIEEVMKVVREIKETSDTTILLVEQNATIALKYADYAYLLDSDGRVALQGPAEEMLANEKVIEVYLGGI